MRRILFTLSLSMLTVLFAYTPFLVNLEQSFIETASAQQERYCSIDSDCASGESCIGNTCQAISTPSGQSGNGGSPTGQSGNGSDPGGQSTNNGGGPSGQSTGNGGGPSGQSSGSNKTCDPTYQLCNPLLSKYDTLCKVLTGVITFITELGAMIAVLLIIWTGFLFVTAQGDPGKYKKARETFKTTIIGTALLLGASGIAQIIVKTVMTITNKDNPGICSI